MQHFKNIHLGNSSLVLTSTPTKLVQPEPLKVVIDNSNQDTSGELIQWGSSNLLPQDFYNKKFLKNGAAVGGINTLKSTMYGNGFAIFKKQRDSKGEVVLVEQLSGEYPSEIDDFIEVNKLDKFWYSKITDLSLFQLAFTEHILSGDGKKIVRVKRHQAAHCRFAKMNEQGVIPSIYINTDWSNAKKELTVSVPFFDEEMTIQEIKDYCAKKKIYNFMTVSRLPLVDESYYPKVDWHAVDRSGWMEVANSIPELKKALFEKQLHFKYVVYISDYYFESFYKEEWDDFDAEKRQKLREELAAAIDDNMSGNEASGGSLISPIFEENGQFVKGITVEPVDNKLKDGSYLPDGSAANSEILFAIGVNPAIIGAGTPGGSNLGGSGSNIREAYTVLSASLAPKRAYVLDDWNFWRAFNGWDRTLIGAFPSVNLTTLDKNPNGQETIANL